MPGVQSPPPRAPSSPPQLPPIQIEELGVFDVEGAQKQQSINPQNGVDTLPPTAPFLSPSSSGDADEEGTSPAPTSTAPSTRPSTPPPGRRPTADTTSKKWLPVQQPSTLPSTKANGAPPSIVIAPAIEDGIWTVSVAEAKGAEGGAYTIYVKTPTHHLTLTRAVAEIQELEVKLSATLPGIKLPASPLHVTGSTLPISPTPRKRSFLTTVSRLVSPSRNATPTSFGSRARQLKSQSSGEPLPDPTAVAQYLTTLSNDPRVRTAKPWRRFVRVRTEDLESRRVERRVRRTRSDLAAHIARKTGLGGLGSSVNASLVGVSASKTAPPGKGLKEMMEESEDEDLRDENTKFVERREKAPEAEKEPEPEPVQQVVTLETALSAETQDGLETVVEVSPTTERRAEADAGVFLPLSTLATEIVSPQPQPLSPPAESPSASILPPPDASHTPTIATRPLTFTPPATPKVKPAPATHVPVPDFPHASLPPRPASADPDTAAQKERMWKRGLSHQPSETDIAETEEDEEPTDAGASAAADELFSGAEEKKGDKMKKRGKGRKIRIEDFEMLRVLGKGCAGKVLLVKYRASGTLYALKAITKRHVLAHQELQHTLTEQAVLKRMAAAGDQANPFVVKLYWSFHDREHLFLIMDFHPGGDLATQLARWGRLGRDRARFYAAEIVEGVEGLHAAGVIYRDLKPENILIGADGHIVLTDFGLSKEFPKRAALPPANGALYSAPGTPPRSTSALWQGNGYADGGFWSGGKKDRDLTSTFCGTAEYLAPEVIQALPYSYEVDWWSFGTMLYEMLTGITPFWANNHSDMYVRVLQDELMFPDDKAMDQDTKSLIRGLLQRNPALRMAEPRIKKHPYFQMIDWSHVYHKRYIPPYIPPIDPHNESDTQNFDETFLDMEPVIHDEPEESERERHDGATTDTNDTETSSVRTAGVESSAADGEEEPDVFDGYSYKARHSIILDMDEVEEEPEQAARPQEEETTSSSGIRSSGTNTDDSRFIESIAPTSLEVSPVQETVKPETEAEAVDLTKDLVVEPMLLAQDLSGETTATVSPAEAPVVEIPAPIAEALEAPVSKVETPASPVKEGLPSPVKPVTRHVEIFAPAADLREQETAPTTPIKPAGKHPRFVPRRPKEKSGIPALDRTIPHDDVFDFDDDDWDLVETPHGEESNSTQGKSLFARGVVDRYRLAVFRRPNSGKSSRTPSSGLFGGSTDRLDGTDSPTQSDSKPKRGRLSIRRSTNQFLRPKSPNPTSMSMSLSSASARPSIATVSVSNPSLSRTTPPTSFHLTPSSRESRECVNSPVSSESLDGVSRAIARGSSEHSLFSDSERPTSPNGKEKHKSLNKVKKITEQGAEKVLSLFHSQHQR
ncbi:hypothetical protein DACRYDRAFT_21614 [Dacryopinax primogenitus]|uniref:Kinase-like protein n=1 Tax=Dacryopinax primogenitus (strain DJM 731) TaxID=1858805 RepID=M5G2T4_DACPD|nr:uncharacterized protein DACRYDRAFT_21614 [Dacryopinax primogenitus]EJU02535.1 hypothetical protein DACRYDRAFT_21614 [Dacryopinax primogenitus]